MHRSACDTTCRGHGLCDDVMTIAPQIGNPCTKPVYSVFSECSQWLYAAEPLQVFKQDAFLRYLTIFHIRTANLRLALAEHLGYSLAVGMVDRHADIEVAEHTAPAGQVADMSADFAESTAEIAAAGRQE